MFIIYKPLGLWYFVIAAQTDNDNASSSYLNGGSRNKEQK